jgi:superoxide reductase
MAEQDCFYKCNICGNVVSSLIAKDPEVVCCGETMQKEVPKPKELEGNEKHVPIVSHGEHKIVVNVGDVPHPMVEDHWIMLIQLIKDGKVIAGKRLNPNDLPHVEFEMQNYDPDEIKARAYCNKHGLWESD